MCPANTDHGALLFSSEALFFRIVGPVNFHARFSRKPASILGSGGFPAKFLRAFFGFALYFPLIPPLRRVSHDCAHHHPVVGLKLPPAYSHLLRQNGDFSQSLRVSGLVSAGDKSAFARPSLHRKFPFPAWGGDWFDDWVVGLQFEPDHLHHPVSANRTFPIRRQIGPFSGDFRPLTSRILVSAYGGAFEWGLLAPCLRIQKFRSRRPGLSAKFGGTAPIDWPFALP